MSLSESLRAQRESKRQKRVTRATRRIEHSRPSETRLPVLLRWGTSDELRLNLVPHVELDKIRDGNGTEVSWHTLAFRVNIGQLLAGQYFDGDVLDIMAKAVLAVSDLGKRYRQVGHFVMKGDEFVAIGAGLNATDELQKATTRKQQLAVYQKVYGRAAAGADLPIGELIQTTGDARESQKMD
jgi:hypothetical protein